MELKNVEIDSDQIQWSEEDGTITARFSSEQLKNSNLTPKNEKMGEVCISGFTVFMIYAFLVYALVMIGFGTSSYIIALIAMVLKIFIK